jgi:hypothetical protein
LPLRRLHHLLEGLVQNRLVEAQVGRQLLELLVLLAQLTELADLRDPQCAVHERSGQHGPNLFGQVQDYCDEQDREADARHTRR